MPGLAVSMPARRQSAGLVKDGRSTLESKLEPSVHVERQLFVYVHAEVLRATLKRQLLVCLTEPGDLLSGAKPQHFGLV